MKAIMIPLLLILLSTPVRAQPVSVLSISRSELERGQTYTVTAAFFRDTAATISAQLALPPGLSGGEVVTATVPISAGITINWRVRVAEDAPMSREPVSVELIVDGVQVDQVHVRVWTEDVIPPRLVWLPLVAK